MRSAPEEPEEINLQPAPISEMPAAALQRAYRLMSGHVDELLAAGGGPGLTALRRDCETFGVELVRRGLI